MNTVLITGLSETLLALLFIAGLIVYKSRERRHRHADFEKLLDDIKDRQGLRANKLIRHLGGRQHIGQADAQRLSEQLIEAEKTFLQQFLSQQLEQQSVASFYENLCQLLDTYLDAGNSPDKQEKQSYTQDNQSNHTRVGADKDAADANQSPESAAEQPTWGDVFD